MCDSHSSRFCTQHVHAIVLCTSAFVNPRHQSDEDGTQIETRLPTLSSLVARHYVFLFYTCHRIRTTMPPPQGSVEKHSSFSWMGVDITWRKSDRRSAVLLLVKSTNVRRPTVKTAKTTLIIGEYDYLGTSHTNRQVYNNKTTIGSWGKRLKSWIVSQSGNHGNSKKYGQHRAPNSAAVCHVQFSSPRS